MESPAVATGHRGLGGRNLSRTDVPLARGSSGDARRLGVEGEEDRTVFALASDVDDPAIGTPKVSTLFL